MDDTSEEVVGFWDSLIKSIKFAFQSIQGKCSLETYLDILSRFTDDEINESLDNGQFYGGGEVTFKTTQADSDIKITVEMSRVLILQEIL